MANLKKKQEVESLLNLLQSSSSFALVKFGQTKHSALEGLRKELKKNDARLRVVKKTTLERAINKLAATDKNLKEVQKNFPLRDESALLILGEDYAKGLSSFFTLSKKEEALGFRLGFFDKKLYSAAEVSKIAQLPSKDQLIAKLIGSFQAPAYNLVYAMQFNLNKFVFVLTQKSKQSS